jgi:hypothetical protein
MSINVYNESNTLFVGNNSEIACSVDLPYQIIEYIVFDSVIVVRLKSPLKSGYNENVFGVSLTCNILWQIPKIKHLYEDSPYTGMIKQGDNILLSNWDGDDLLVEPITGKILSKQFSK